MIGEGHTLEWNSYAVSSHVASVPDLAASFASSVRSFSVLCSYTCVHCDGGDFVRRVRAGLFLAILFGVTFAGATLFFSTSSGDSTTSSEVTATTPLITTTTLAGPSSVCNPTCIQWRPLDAWASSLTQAQPSIESASVSTGSGTSATHAYAFWINSKVTQLALYPGYKGPGVTALARGPEEIPPRSRGTLLAAFNSGFYETDAPAGFYVHHTLYFPMRRGLATVVRYQDGSTDVMTWTGGARPGPDVVMARQNLPLLVDNSAPTTLSATNSAWGLTLHGVADVWRTALGVDASGNLIYAAAPAQTSTSLAHLMVSLGCVRAMQLDINPEWPIFVTYENRGALGAHLDVPNPNQIATRFLYSSTKDFFAVFASDQPGSEEPW
jgi:hypothetical protein